MKKKTQLERQQEAVEEIEAQIAKELEEQTSPVEVKDETEAPAVDPKDPPTKPEPSAQPEAPPAEPIPPPQEDNIWQRRYESLQGKYNAEVPRLNTQVRELSNKLEELTEQLKKKPEPAETEANTGVTQADIENFGPDMIDVINRLAQSKAVEATKDLSSRLDSLLRENRDLKNSLQQVSETQQTTAQSQLFQTLTSLVPNWKQINSDQRFHAWLAEYDPISGLQRQSLLEDAQRQNNADRIATIFNAFLNTLPKAPAPAPQNNSEVERQVQPGRSKVTPQPSASSQKVLSQADIHRFYVECAQGKYQGRDADRIKMEQEIDAAVAEGRVR